MGFFLKMYLFIGPSQSAFKSPKQLLTYVYFISADDRELCVSTTPFSQLCAACRTAHGVGRQGEGRRNVAKVLQRLELQG